MIVRQGPIALAVGEDGGYLDIFTLLNLFSSLSPSLSGVGPVETEILSHRAATKSKTTKQISYKMKLASFMLKHISFH